MNLSAINTTSCLNASTKRKHSGLFFGLPLSQGRFSTDDHISLLNQRGEPVAANFQAKTFWPDGSIKWLNTFAVASEGDVFFVSDATQEKPNTQGDENPHITLNGKHIVLPDINAHLSICYQMTEKKGELKVKHHDIEQVAGHFTRAKFVLNCLDAAGLFIVCNVTSVHATGEYNIRLRIENHKAAEHPNGTWDLGDSQSIELKNLSISLITNDAQSNMLHVKDEAVADSTLQASAPYKLTQHASGGHHWQSPVHVNANNEVPLKEQGFHLTSNEHANEQGLRAQPWVAIQKNSTQKLFFCVADFWQNFPCALSGKDKSVTVELFPELTELQAGESKQWQFQLGDCALYTNGTEPSFEQVGFKCNPDYINQTAVLATTYLANDNQFSGIIQQGIEGVQSFYHKRERCDEYGWRNFGEVYADHEAIGKPESPIFVSHYNNQYDTLMGTTIQALCSPKSNWLQISQPLAKHIEDIDIYNTECDKPEYNGGLFWHTDHYLPAITCTHRTYSKTHTAVYDGHQGGGGPGGQHCYSGGLLMHAQLFQDDIAEEKVAQLTRWIRHFYNGNQSLLGRLHRFVSIDLKAGSLTNIGFVQPGFRYPLDRGTGNYINTLIDCFELKNEQALLDEAAFVIRNTVGLKEDLTERNLQDVENAWFYTVFLQAIIKFLRTKELNQQNDGDYAYARQVLSMFGAWMLEHEEPYLNKPEKLEFPTDTWAAQDIRKAVIFQYLAYFDHKLSERYSQKSDQFSRYVNDKLTHSDEASTTRCLAILMQNYGLIEKAKSLGQCPVSPVALTPKALNSHGQSIWLRLLTDLLSRLPRFSFSCELHWLKTRLGKNVTKKEWLHD